MNCPKHPEESAPFQCFTCATALCRKCGPIAIREVVFCEQCNQAEEALELQKRYKKPGWSPRRLVPVLLTCLILAGGSASIYLVVYHPRVITINADDQARIGYYLERALMHGRGTPGYRIQVDNASRLSSHYRHVVRFLEQGQNAFDQGDFVRAVDRFQKVKQMLPEWEPVYHLIAECFDALGQPDALEQELKLAILLRPGNVESYCWLGRHYEGQKKFDEAIMQYTKAFITDQRNSEVLMHLAGLYVKKEHFLKAKEFRDRAKRLGADTRQIDALLPAEILASLDGLPREPQGPAR